jgi:hypothetical protein
MFEQEGAYTLITYVGNANIPKAVHSIYAKEAGGNADTWEKYQQREKAFEALEGKRDRWFGASSSLVKYMPPYNLKPGYWSETKRKAFRFFLHADEWADIFIKQVFGSIEVVGAYLDWFEKKRKELREYMKKGELAIVKADLETVKISQKQITHGGVANLLKVLTKTMEKQGADIRSIAKVQYTICTQAGILIPDEFIEDVAVILHAEDNNG